MRWSYRLGEWFGIGVHVHLTFVLLLAWIALSSGSLASVLFVMALFSFVVMHEYGHALTARYFGIRTRQITLYPIGGVASLEGMPERPGAQALVAIAGPAVNFALALLLSVVGWVAGVDVLAAPAFAGGGASWLPTLVQANLVLGTFNLLPALPMDGGRILKALLSMRMDAVRATEIAARVARVVAIGMGLFGLFGEPGRPMLVMIALFVWFAAAGEERLSRVLARRAMGGRATADASLHDERGASRYNAWPTDRYRAQAESRPRRVRLVVIDGPFGRVLRAVPID